MLSVSIKEMLEDVLEDLRLAGGVDASAIVSREGLIIASDVSQEVSAETFATLGVSMLATAETAVSELKKGVLEYVIAASREGAVIATSAGSKASLVVMAKRDASLGLILIGMNKAKERIEYMLRKWFEVGQEGFREQRHGT